MIVKAKSLIKSAFPGGARIYRRLNGRRQQLHNPNDSLENTFRDIYQNNSWTDPESVSGRGSTLSRTAVIRQTLPALLESVSAKTLLDAACGDFNWLRHVALEGIEYIGIDVVPELIAQNRLQHESENRRFLHLNIIEDQLPIVDVILCRDCFIHFSFKHIHAAIANFKWTGSKFLLATTHTSVRKNRDIRTGEWHSVNLELAPFNFPSPVELIIEDRELGKCLGMWRLEEL